MQREMHHIKVFTKENGNTVILQEWNDMNERDPEIEISPDQVGMVASWLLEANAEKADKENESSIIPANVWMGGPESESQELEIFQNQHGMVVLKISDDIIVELSPNMAKRAREKLTKAIGDSFVDMLRNDNDV